MAKEHEVLLTIEEGAIGGFGSHVANFLADDGRFDAGLKYRSLILPDIFIDQDKPDAMYETAGLTAPHIVQRALMALGLDEAAIEDVVRQEIA